MSERFVAVGDIHGCPEQLEEILELGQAFPDHQWVFLGDYLNRGPDPERVLRRLQTLSAIFLLGNHETRFLAEWERAQTPRARWAWLDATGLSEDSVHWLQTVPVAHWRTETYGFLHAFDTTPWPTQHLRWLVHGHTPVDTPQVVDNRINLNTRCGQGGPLTAVALPELVFFQSSRSPLPASRAPVPDPSDEDLHSI